MLPEISADRVQLALSEARQAALYPEFAFPWRGLGDMMDRNGLGYVWLIGYGSLLSRASAARTMDVSERSSRVAAVAFGGRRAFSYRIPQGFLRERYQVTDGRRYAALNCRVTYDPKDYFNGILTRLFREDIDAFRLREFAYDLKPLPVFEWHEPQKPHRIAYVLDCPPAGDREDHPYASDAPPQSNYYRLCREGAAAISEDFLRCYLETTYLGDGATRVVDWESESGVLLA